MTQCESDDMSVASDDWQDDTGIDYDRILEIGLSEAEVNRILESLASIRGKKSALKSSYERRTARLDSAERGLLHRYGQMIQQFAAARIAKAASMSKRKNPGKFVDLDFGRICRTDTSEKPQIVEPDALLSWLSETEEGGLIMKHYVDEKGVPLVSQKLNTQSATRMLKACGYADVPGVRTVEGHSDFHIEMADESRIRITNPTEPEDRPVE